MSFIFITSANTLHNICLQLIFVHCAFEGKKIETKINKITKKNSTIVRENWIKSNGNWSELEKNTRFKATYELKILHEELNIPQNYQIIFFTGNHKDSTHKTQYSNQKIQRKTNN